MKKIIAIATALTVSVMLVGPGVAQGATVEELTAQINTLLAQLATLQAQVAAMGGSTGATACTFTRNLSQGSTGADVTCLQQYLNSTATKVAASGNGSPGHETTYYGSLTAAAVAAWQAANGVVCGSYCGYFGPISKAKYTALAGGGGTPPVTCGNGTCGAGETNANCPSDCPATGATEGSYTATIAASPANQTYDAGADRDVYGIDIKAYNSNITIGRIDLQVGVAALGVALNPATFITGIKIYDGSTLLKEVSSPVFTQDANLNYFTQVAGINALVTKDTTKTLTVKFTTTSSIDVARVVAVNVYGANGIRGVDTVGINSYQALATVRTHTLNVPGNGVLTASASVDMPVSQNWSNEVATGSLNVPLLKFNVKATVGSVDLIRLGVNMASGAGLTSVILPTVIRLYDGDTLVASASDTTTRDVATFENFRLTVAKDATKNLTVKGDFLPVDAATNTNPTNNNISVLALPATSANSVYQTGTGALAQSVITGGIAGNNQFLFRIGTKFTFVSGTASTQNGGLDTDNATGVLKFKVEPFGGTMTQFRFASAASATTTVVVYAYSPGGVIVASGASRAITTNPATNTPDGGSADVTVTQTITDTSSGSTGMVRFKIDYISWTTGAAVVDQGNVINMLDNWVTPYVFLQ